MRLSSEATSGAVTASSSRTTTRPTKEQRRIGSRYSSLSSVSAVVTLALSAFSIITVIDTIQGNVFVVAAAVVATSQSSSSSSLPTHGHDQQLQQQQQQQYHQHRLRGLVQHQQHGQVEGTNNDRRRTTTKTSINTLKKNSLRPNTVHSGHTSNDRVGQQDGDGNYGGGLDVIIGTGGSSAIPSPTDRCDVTLLTANAHTSIEDEYFTYSSTNGQSLDFRRPDNQHGNNNNDVNEDGHQLLLPIGDTIQLAAFAAYRDEIQCVGDESVLQLDSSFFLFGYDGIEVSRNDAAAGTAADTATAQPFNHSFFLMSFNMACNVCTIQDDCGIPVFFDEQQAEEEEVDSTTAVGSGCYCRPPTREAFLRNLNERLQQHPQKVFDGITVDSVEPIVVSSPPPPSPPQPSEESQSQQQESTTGTTTTTTVSTLSGIVPRSSPGLGQDVPIVVSTVPSHCRQSPQQQQDDQQQLSSWIPSYNELLGGNVDGNNSVQGCNGNNQVMKIVNSIPTIECL